MTRFLLTNDDGIAAPGLAALERVAANWGAATVLAPADHRSGCSHQATTDRRLSLAGAGEGRHSLDGTPVDCTRIGLSHVAPQCEWVLSGINEGGNLGADVYHSGTVAAVREAALLGKPGIAFSQYRRRRLPIDWQRASAWAADALAWIFSQSTPAGSFWNVNFPDLEPDSPAPTIVECPCDTHPLPVRFQVEGNEFHYRGEYHQRLREPNGDVAVCFGGNIAVTRFAVR